MNLFGFPCHFVIFQRMGHRNGSTIQHNELFVEVDIDVEVIDLILPFLIHLVLESKFNIITIHLHAVDEEQRDLIRAENLCPHYIVHQWL